MAGNPFKKLASGDEFRVSAKAWNTLMDVAQREYGQAGRGAAAGIQVAGDRTLVRVLNSTGASVDRFAVLGIAGVAINATENLKDFQNVPVLNSATPDASHLGRFVITTEPIRNGKIGRCMLAGVVAVKVSMVESGQRWADVLAGDSTQLESGNVGTAQILWSESGTGTKWALVRLGVLPGVVVVKVTGAESGGGKYTGRVLAWGGAPAATGDLAESDVGGVPAADDALIENLNEVGQSTHALTDASNTYENLFLGSVRGITDDGRWAVAINGFFGGCESS
jgi:hypothetical protein